MATSDDLSKQLEITTKLAAMVERMAKASERVGESYESQISLIEKLQTVINSVDTSKSTQQVEALNSAKLDKLKKNVEETTDSLSGMGKKLADAAKTMSDKFPLGAAAAAGGVAGFYQGLKNLVGISKGALGFVLGLGDALLNVGMSILSIPLKIFSGLVDMAANAEGGSNELAQAIENLRKEFGALGGPTPKTIMDMSQSLKGFNETGLNAFRVFGNLAERIEAFTKLAVAMGATFQSNLKEFKDNGGAILAYQKGLGIADEEMKAFGANAVARGTKLSKVLNETTKYALDLGKAFGIDSKIISKDMSKALVDVARFAGASIKEIGQAATYARKLGLELNGIVGTLDAFETFDSAAENVAKLSQAFGVQVDAFQLMEAQDPAQQIEMLRGAFKNAGVDASNFNRQQLKLLAQTTGLDAATAKLAFSMNNQGASLADIKKKGGEAERKTLSQADAMAKLADSIERMVQSGGGQTGGFMDMFVKGFLGGIQSSKEFVGIIFNIKRALQTVYMEGVKLGRAFVEMFPGVKDFLGGIKDFFDPSKFKALTGGVVNILIDFFKKLTTGKWSFSELMEQIQTKFFDFFNSEMPAGRKVLSGFKTIITTISKILGEGVKWVGEKLADAFKFVAEVIRDPNKLMGGGTAAAGGALGFLGEILAPLAAGLADAWKIVAPAAMDLLKTVGQKIYGYLTSDEFMNLIKPALPYVAAIVFGPAFAKAIFSAITASVAKAAINTFTSGSGKDIMEQAGTAAQKMVDAQKKVANKGGDTKGADAVAKMTEAGGKAIKSGDKWGVQDAIKLGVKLIALAGALAVGGLMLAGAVVGMKKILDSGGVKSAGDLTAPLLTLAAVAIAAVPLTFAMKLVSNVSPGAVLKGGLVLGAAVGIVGLVGAGLTYALSQVGSPAQLSAAANTMMKMSLVFLAMVPLIVASIAIGAVVSNPVTILAAAVGMTAISAAVSSMTTTAIEIIKEISKMNVGSGFASKIDAFVGVMRAIQAFTDSMVKVIGLMGPSLAEFLTGTGEAFSEKVDSAAKLIGEMVGQRGSGKGIIGVVEIVMDSIAEMKMGEGVAEAANTFSSVIGAVGAFMQAATPPDAFYAAGDNFLQRLSGGKPFADLAVDVGFYMLTLREGMFLMLTGDKTGAGSSGILGIIGRLAEINIPDPAKAEKIIALLTATASIVKSLVPDPEVIKSFKQVEETSGAWGLIKKRTEKLDTQGISDVLMTMGTQLGNLIETLTSTVIKTVINQTKGISKEQLGAISVFGDILKIVVSLAQAFGEVSKGASVNVGNVDAGGLVNVISQAPSMAAVMNEMEKGIGPLMESLQKVITKIPTDAAFAKNVDVAAKIFAFIGEIPKLAQGMNSAAKGSASGDIDTDPLFQTLAKLTMFFYRVTHEKGQGTSMPVLQELFANIDKIGALGLDQRGDTLVKTTEKLSKIFSAVNQTTSELGKMMMTGQQAAGQINSGAIAVAVKAVQDMVQAANDLNSALSNGDLNKIDVQAKLSKVATAVGLGGKANYTIKNNGVAVTVNLQVSMNVDEVEKIMILRGKSLIRDRINFLSDKTDNAPGKLPNSPNSPVSFVEGTGGASD